ncbi:MAG: lipocalin family protein [Bacteroidetes bacterium]|nr:lipocalin family protein [Fibrella sp.]
MTLVFCSFYHSFRSLFVAIALLSVTIGCGDSNDNDTPTVAQLTTLEGNWKVNALKTDPKVLGFDDLVPVYTVMYGTCINDITFSFKAGGAVGYDNPASCASSAVSVATISAATGIDANSTWSQSGNTLVITTSKGAKTTYTTTFGTSTAQLKWQGAYDFTMSGTQTNYNLTLELRKL